MATQDIQAWETGPIYGPFFGVMGAASAVIFSALGAAYGTAQSGSGIAAMAVMRPELVNQSIIPVVMAGIIAIYGLVVAAVISNNIRAPPDYKLYQGFLHLGAGLSVGLSGLAAGFAIGKFCATSSERQRLQVLSLFNSSSKLTTSNPYLIMLIDSCKQASLVMPVLEA